MRNCVIKEWAKKKSWGNEFYPAGEGRCCSLGGAKKSTENNAPLMVTDRLVIQTEAFLFPLSSSHANGWCKYIAIAMCTLSSPCQQLQLGGEYFWLQWQCPVTLCKCMPGIISELPPHLQSSWHSWRVQVSTVYAQALQRQHLKSVIWWLAGLSWASQETPQLYTMTLSQVGWLPDCLGVGRNRSHLLFQTGEGESLIHW